MGSVLKGSGDLVARATSKLTTVVIVYKPNYGT